jgi:hypothetical protein
MSTVPDTSVPTRVPCIIATTGRNVDGLTYTPESLQDLQRWLLDNVKVFVGRGDPAEIRQRGHRPLTDLGGILVRESMRYNPMSQALEGEVVLHPRFARTIAAIDQCGDQVRIEVEGIPRCRPGTNVVTGWKAITSVNFVAPTMTGWEHSVREADSPIDDADLKEWSREMDQRVYDTPPALGVEHVVDFLPGGEVRESVMRRGYYDLAAGGLIPSSTRLGPLACQRGRQVPATATGGVREAATPPSAVRSSRAARPAPSAPQRLQQSLAMVSAGVQTMLAADNANARDSGLHVNCAGYPVLGATNVAVHESVAAGLFGYGLQHTLGERATQPLDTAAVREANAVRRPSYLNPNNPAESYGGLQHNLDVAHAGVASLFAQRPTGAQQQSAPGTDVEAMVGAALLGKTL